MSSTSQYSENQPPVLLFDGVCNLCNASVQWVLKRDKKGVFRFASLQSDAGQALLRQQGLPTTGFDTVVLIDAGRVYLRSDAPLRVAAHLGGLWPLFGLLKIVPRALRNAVYNWIARNRFRWFGQREECWLPRKEWRERFL
jgi:predicted DCC family thiol-disulfide oxidoreductase YuxK